MKRLAMVCALACLGCAAPARAGLVGSGGEALTAPAVVDVLIPKVAVTPSGWTFVAWARMGSIWTSDSQLWGAWRPPGGKFGPPWRIGVGQLGDMVTTSDGQVLVAISDWSNPHSHALSKVLMLHPGDTSGILAGVSLRQSGAPRLAVDGHGDAIAVAMDEEGINVATRRKGGEFGAAQQLPGSIENGGVSLAADDAGDFAVVNASSQSVAWVRPAGASSFGPRESIPDAAPLISEHAAMTDRGTLVVASSRFIPNATSVSSGGVLLLRPRGGVFGPPFVLSHTGFGGVLAPAEGGGLTVFDNADDGSLRTRELSATGALSEPVSFAPAGTTIDSDPVTAGHNTFVGASVNAPGAPSVLGAVVALSERPPDGAFSPLVPISEPNAMQPALAANRDGALALTWVQWVRSGGRAMQEVRVAVRDGAAELDLTAGSATVSPGGVASIPVVCTGIKDCVGNIAVAPRTSVAHASMARSGRSVRVRRGHSEIVRVRVGPHHARHVRLKIALRGVGRKAATRTVRLRLRG